MTTDIATDTIIPTGTTLVDNPYFWVTLAFVIFCVLAYKYGRKAIVAMLDDRTESIRKTINEAETLRREAQELLADFQKKHRDALNEAEEILATAKERAVAIEKSAEERLITSLEKRKEQAETKIALAEEQALQEIKASIVDIATDAATALLVKQNAGKAGSSSIDKSIEDFERLAMTK